MIRVLNIMVSSINISWMLAENWIPMARLLNKYIAWNSYRLSNWSLLILSQLHAIVRPLNLFLLSMPPPIRFATFLFFFLFFFSSLLMYRIYDSWPSQNLLEQRVSLLGLWIFVKLLKKDGTFQSIIIGLLFKYCCSKGLSTHATDIVNFQGMIYNLLVNMSNIFEIFTITKSVLLPTIMYNILSFKIVSIHH